MINVAVYGTLKRGYSNHTLLKSAEFLGHGVTKEKLRMLDTGGFPVCFYGGLAAVVVEAYAVDTNTLTALDRLEWNGTMFVRRLHDVFIGSHNSKIECNIYLGVEEFWNRRLSGMSEVQPIDDRSGVATLCWPVEEARVQHP